MIKDFKIVKLNKRKPNTMINKLNHKNKQMNYFGFWELAVCATEEEMIKTYFSYTTGILSSDSQWDGTEVIHGELDDAD